MGESELEKRMEQIVPRDKLGADIFDHGVWSAINETYTILEEMWSEFPLTNPELEKDSDYWSELASKRLQWKKKWSGK